MLTDLLGNRTFLKRGSKGQGLRSVIGGFRSVLCVSLFQSSLLVIVIMTAVKNTIVKAAFEL